MTAQPVDTALVVTWLVFAHLVADFVLQNDWIAIHKGAAGREGWSALAVHGFHVGLCLLPVVAAFGIAGLAYLVVVVVSHMVVDRWKVLATRRADRRAQEDALRRLERTGSLQRSPLGGAWTPWPGMLFLADQALHVTILLLGWLVILDGVTLIQPFVDFVDAVIRSWDPAAFHVGLVVTLVLASLFIVNTRGAYYFGLALLSPRDLRINPTDPEGASSVAGSPSAAASPPAPGSTAPGPPPAAGSAAAGPAAPAPRAAGSAAAAGPTVPPAFAAAVSTGAPARIAVTIAAVERLLIAGLVLAGPVVGSLAVVALDVAARWRQLDDRGYAEAYLLSMLASVSVAIGSGLVGLAALRTLG